MMEFARRLAPLREGDATRATAALPSRFAAESPLRVAASPRVDDEQPVLETAAHAPTVTRRVRAPDAPHAAAPEVDAATVVVAESRGDRSRQSSATPAPREHRAEAAELPAAPTRLVAQAQPHEAPAPHRVIAAVAAPDAVDAARASSVRQRPVQTANAAPLGNTNGPAVRHEPMSAAALAARNSQPAEQRPIIHVTIDRIDVRAPAAPARPAPAPRARTATPTVSLGDYLRARANKPGGAS
jgi:hypothetical protein